MGDQEHATVEREEGEVLNVLKERQDKAREEERIMFQEAAKMLEEQRLAKEAEIVELKKKKAIRRKEREEQLAKMRVWELERRAREREEAKLRKIQAEEKKKQREAARRAMINPLAYKGTGVQKFDEDRKFLMKDDADFAVEREQAIEKRVPPLSLDGLGEEAMRKLAEDLYDRIKKKFGKIFDMKKTLEKKNYYHMELTQRIAEQEKERQNELRSGIVSKRTGEGGFMEGVKHMTADQKKDSIMTTGGVASRQDMFGGSAVERKNITGRIIDITK